MVITEAIRRRRGSATPESLRNGLARLSGCAGVADGRVAIACTYCGTTGEVWWEPSRHNGHRLVPRRSRASLHVDHIMPVARGGEHLLSNVAWACQPCNIAKGTKSADEFKAGL